MHTPTNHDSSAAFASTLRAAIDSKTKPLGSLGVLEEVAFQLGMLQRTVQPVVTAPAIVVFAGDHGVAQHGVSAYPPEVTWQMVMNFVNGGAAINVFCRANELDLTVVDAGVNHDLSGVVGVVHAKVARGTQPFHLRPAMTMEQCMLAMDRGAQIVRERAAMGCTLIGFGEMGIGNTSSASMIMHLLTGLPLAQCIGRGAGADEAVLATKRAVLEAAASLHGHLRAPLDALAAVGGFEMAMMCGAFRETMRHPMLVLVDGFICTAAYAVAVALEPALKKRCVFAHESGEAGHRAWLEQLDARPLLHLGLRLGEGTGAALAMPLVRAAAAMLTEMASFQSAGVSDRT